MSDNLRHWSALEKTDPTHTKSFNRGRFSGTAIKPIWNEQMMTSHFGPCGVGWGMDKPEFTLVPVANEICVYCTVALWYRDAEVPEPARVYGVGGDKVLRVESKGPFISDEAYKAAYTDALGNAFKHIGLNADIHMGRFDDHKYVRELRAEFADDQEAAPHPASPPKRETARPIEHQPQPDIVEPREMSDKREAEKERFFGRESYRVDPDVTGWPQWDRVVLSLFRYAAKHRNLDEFQKLRSDIMDDFEKWEKDVVAKPVVASFRKTVSDCEARLFVRLGIRKSV